MPRKKPDQRDIEVARRMRAARVEKGLTQEKLGSALGLTFQQVQKYENGTNRIAAGRLHKIAEVLGVPVAVLSYYAACLVPGRDSPPLGFGLPSQRHWRSRLLSPALRLASRLVMRDVRRRASAVRRRYGLAPLRGSIGVRSAA